MMHLKFSVVRRSSVIFAFKIFKYEEFSTSKIEWRKVLNIGHRDVAIVIKKFVVFIWYNCCWIEQIQKQKFADFFK